MRHPPERREEGSGNPGGVSVGSGKEEKSGRVQNVQGGHRATFEHGEAGTAPVETWETEGPSPRP